MNLVAGEFKKGLLKGNAVAPEMVSLFIRQPRKDALIDLNPQVWYVCTHSINSWKLYVHHTHVLTHIS